MKKKNNILNSTPCCNCGAFNSKIYYGSGERKNCEKVQLIKCLSCKKIMLAEPDHHPLSRQVKNRDVLLKILIDLAKGKSIRKTATVHQASPGTVVNTEKKMQEYIRLHLNIMAKETGLSTAAIVGLINRTLDH